jgi:S-sulfo-L-cysteine synthase (3-phospho-L-serine-dependent)
MHFVFVESNTTGTGRLAVERLLAAGHRVTFCCRSRSRYPFLSPHPALSVIELDTNDQETLRRHFAGLCRQRTVDAVLTFSSFYVVAVAELAAENRLRFLSPEAARSCHDKHLTRQALRAAGLPTPDFWIATSADEDRELAAQLRYPVVVKPCSEAGSTGVKLVHDAEQLVTHAGGLRARGTNERGQGTDERVLIESVIEGPEYSVETLTFGPGDTRLVGITAKLLSRLPHFVEMGHDFPARLAPELERTIGQAVAQALAAVGFDFGPAHIELRLTGRGPVIVEINPRLAGGMIPELIRYASGVDLLAVWLDMLCGRPVDLRPSCQQFASIRFFTAPRAGRLAGVEGIEQAGQLPYVRLIHLDKAPGSEVHPATRALDRIGFVISSGPEAAGVVQSVTAALDSVRIAVA